MTSLVSIEEFADARGVEPDGTDVKALRFLEDASDLFRSLARQTISLVTDDEVELEGTWSPRLWLPERPVLDVKDVTVRRGASSTPVADSALEVTRRGMLKGPTSWAGPDATVELTYTHGFAEIPGDVRRVVIGFAMRAMSNPRGVVSRTIGSYSEAFALGVEQVGLTVYERVVVHRYRPRVPR